MIDQLIDKYIRLRDRKDEMEEKYDTAVAQINEALDKVEAVILAHLNTNNLESVAGTTGTAFKQNVTSATVGDKDAFMNHVRTHSAWELLDVRANKTAVTEYKTAHENTLPPGVNWREEIVIRVRRPNKSKTEAETV